jgi:hypothetical protein
VWTGAFVCHFFCNQHLYWLLLSSSMVHTDAVCKTGWQQWALGTKARNASIAESCLTV